MVGVIVGFVLLFGRYRKQAGTDMEGERNGVGQEGKGKRMGVGYG